MRRRTWKQFSIVRDNTRIVQLSAVLLGRAVPAELFREPNLDSMGFSECVHLPGDETSTTEGSHEAAGNGVEKALSS